MKKKITAIQFAKLNLNIKKLYSPCPDVYNHYTMRQTLFLKTHMT